MRRTDRVHALASSEVVQKKVARLEVMWVVGDILH